MRLLLILGITCLSLALARGESIPPALEDALQKLNTDAPSGWAFTQTSEGAGKSRVERYRALGPEPARWDLIAVDGRTPTDDELQEYRKHQALRAGVGRAPNVKEQINRETAAQVETSATHTIWEFRLRPATEDDTWAEHMVARFHLNHETGLIDRVELFAPQPFSPMFAVNVTEARTVMVYSPPGDDRPSLLREITVRVRGRAWLFRSLDSDLSVRYSDYTYVGKK